MYIVFLYGVIEQVLWDAAMTDQQYCNVDTICALTNCQMSSITFLWVHHLSCIYDEISQRSCSTIGTNTTSTFTITSPDMCYANHIIKIIICTWLVFKRDIIRADVKAFFWVFLAGHFTQVDVVKSLWTELRVSKQIVQPGIDVARVRHRLVVLLKL